VDEFARIQHWTAQRQSGPWQAERGVVDGIGDDAAVVDLAAAADGVAEPKRLVLAVDTMVETVHFLPETMREQDVGYKALAANVSDIAAMGGVPLHALVSVSVPRSYGPERMRRLYDGLYECAERYGVAVVGGDTTSSPSHLVVAVTVTGTVTAGQELRRSGAKPGDVVFVTAATGLAAAGLHALLARGGEAAATASAPADHAAGGSLEAPFDGGAGKEAWSGGGAGREETFDGDVDRGEPSDGGAGREVPSDGGAESEELPGGGVDREEPSDDGTASSVPFDGGGDREVPHTFIRSMGVAVEEFGVIAAIAGSSGVQPEQAARIVQAHRRPSPSVRAGRLLQEHGCRSLNDVSDGLASEAWELAEASGLRLVLEESLLPISGSLAAYAAAVGRNPLDWILYGGEDYALLGTLAPEQADAARAAFRKEGIPFFVIGRTEAGAPDVELDNGKQRLKLQKRGYNHFS
jgi:thiamine monophosphate kinase